jgi:hypothetical protein
MVLAHDNPYCCSQLAFIHDELQYECDPEHAPYFKSHLELQSLTYYNLRIPIDAEGKIGQLGRSTKKPDAVSTITTMLTISNRIKICTVGRRIPIRSKIGKLEGYDSI